MQSLVECHIATISKRLVADRALIRFLSCVRPQVLLQQHLPGEPLGAFGTLVWLNPCVNPDVHVERHPLVEGLGTVGTHVLLPVPVDLQVTAQVSLVVEDLPALWTVGRKLFCPLVNGQVVLVVPQLGESLATLLALVAGLEVEQSRRGGFVHQTRRRYRIQSQRS